jgi:hypothetical protein
MRQFQATGCLAFAGAILAGGMMAAGTLLLGHARPMWMELENSGLCALVGFIAGAGTGLVLGPPSFLAPEVTMARDSVERLRFWWNLPISKVIEGLGGRDVLI